MSMLCTLFYEELINRLFINLDPQTYPFGDFYYPVPYFYRGF